MKQQTQNQQNIFATIKRQINRTPDGDKIIRQRYFNYSHAKLDDSPPTTFMEKLYTRMLLLNHGKYKTFTKLSDKLLVRNYVKKCIGEKYLSHLYWTGSEAKSIPFSTLPSRYVIKTNHGSGGNIFASSPPNYSSIIDQLTNWMNTNYYWEDREFQYFNIRPQILIEEFLDDGESDGPLDYRFWCFDGAPRLVQVDDRRHSINPFYDTEWNKTSFRYRNKFRDVDIGKPDNFSEMLTVASHLARDFDFVRVDIYNINGRIVFGELTFTPVAGRLNISPPEWNSRLGKLWNFRIY